jgi:uncharacterized protein (TIGR03435 family)
MRLNRSYLSLIFHFSVISFLVFQPGAAEPLQSPQPAPAQTQPVFEVASVKTMPDLSRQSFRVEPGALKAQMGLMWLIAWAYSVPVTQVTAPDWVRMRGVDIQAKADRPVSEDQIRLMLRKLLTDRFKLQVHHEAKVTNVFALGVGKEGSRLKTATGEGPWKRRFDREHLRETFTSVSLKEFTEFLAQYYNGTVDRTGLAGRYDFALDYKGLIDPNDQKPLSTAVIEARREALRQVGLRLDMVKQSLDFLAVDQVEKNPTEN